MDKCIYIYIGLLSKARLIVQYTSRCATHICLFYTPGMRESFIYLLPRCVSRALSLITLVPPDLMSAGLLPVVSIGVNQAGRLNLGRRGGSLRCFALYGLQEGYQPFAVNMAREPPLWMSWRQPQFTSILPHHRDLMVSLHRVMCMYDVIVL